MAIAAAAAAAGFIDVMSAILLTLFINPHPSKQATNQPPHTQSISYRREEEEEEEEVK